MKRSRYTEEQIAFALKQAELGTPVPEVCRKMGVSDATFYNWRKKYGGLGPSELKRLKQLEEENHRLKKLVADLSLDKAMLQDVVAKNVWSAPLLQGTTDDQLQFAKMYPASHESGAFDAKAMMNYPHIAFPNSFEGLRARFFVPDLRYADRLFAHLVHTIAKL